MCCFLSRRRNTPMPMLVKNIFLYDEARDRNEINAKRRRRCGDGPRTRVLSTNERTHSVVGEASRRDTESLHNHESDLRNAQGKEKKSIR